MNFKHFYTLKICKLTIAICSNISFLLYMLGLTCSRLAIILITLLSARMLALDSPFGVLSDEDPIPMESLTSSNKVPYMANIYF